MKKIAFLLFLLMVCFPSLLGAQVRTTSFVSANLMPSMQITKNSDIDFGTIATSGVKSTVILVANSTGARTSSGSNKMAHKKDNVTAAGFTIKGEGNAVYSITMPTTDLLVYSGNKSMVVSGFTSSASKVLAEGQEIIYLGATLYVDENQVAGAYSNFGSGMEVTVNYN